MNTVKGKGYYPAEKNPTQFHGIGKFDINTGEPKSSGKNFSACFGETMCNFAKKTLEFAVLLPLWLRVRTL